MLQSTESSLSDNQCLTGLKKRIPSLQFKSHRFALFHWALRGGRGSLNSAMMTSSAFAFFSFLLIGGTFLDKQKQVHVIQELRFKFFFLMLQNSAQRA